VLSPFTRRVVHLHKGGGKEREGERGQGGGGHGGGGGRQFTSSSSWVQNPQAAS